MKVGVPKETFPGETRVAMTPTPIPQLEQAGLEVVVEQGAGSAAGFPDDAFAEKGARIGSRQDALGADIVLQVRTLGSNPDAGRADLDSFHEGQYVIGFSNPLAVPEAARDLAARGVMSFSIELMPRITRAQSMDGLSSQATVGGYRAVLLAAEALPKMFPMMTTAAGTIAPARVLVIGAGVAGLQAIATSRRLGGVVEAYDVRPAVKDEVKSLGATFLELPLETQEGAGGYAKEQSEDFLRRQRELIGDRVAASDVVITTAAIPGRKAPILVTADMVRRMRAGSVIVDLAAETGGNVELTRAGEIIQVGGVTIDGTRNLPSTMPVHASQLYSKNVSTLLLVLVKDGAVKLDFTDEIVKGACVTYNGEVVNPRAKELVEAATK